MSPSNPSSPVDQVSPSVYDSDDEKSVFIASIQYNDESFLIDVPEDKSIGTLKEKLQLYTCLQPSEMRLIVRGRIFQDSELLANISPDDTFTLVKIIANNSTNPNNNSSISSSSSDQHFATERGFDANILKMMSSMMKTPSFQDMFKKMPSSILGNSSSDPAIKSLMEKNPELEHILNDPAIIKETMKAFENPALQREMMRNQDLAMSNIEMLPEGFNALRRSYANIQKPLLDAMDESMSRNPVLKDSLLASSITQKTVNKEPIPNPWNPAAKSKLRGSAPGSKSTMFLSKLADMKEMGFTNEEENARVLTLCEENLDMAINILLASRTSGGEKKQ
ncbi:ubiquilin-1-like protein [Mitosporidium daphniae]|uniref:Ubiquilin-1-like protein n=1 Tax=Mitosporidium daphniae TaxID=1485682 RepID=A0A098VU95_9MICR|nr:ubiquilin-1-like protein [Mitosporidium daphniae]KGG52364.1 ubiquilin-1-like protein [Mitosporidium daphniae]|eukprot:XP_013238800.1 ubiquilin-1-like protein [Mitosporidium daphniae]